MRRIYAPIAWLALLAAFASPVSADTLGQTESFLVNRFYDASGAGTISATLRAVGQFGYFYVDDRYWDSLTATERNLYGSNLSALSTQFDGTIYPRVTSFYGSENTPGVDNDSHVTILMQRLTSGSGGYFETIHSYSKERAPQSNAREMVFINVESARNTSGRTFVAHEFQHLVSFNQKELILRAEDDLWLNEGRSEYAITLSGYSNPFEGSSLQRRAQAFVRTPSDSLVDWPNTTLDYALTSVFLHYLADIYGEPMVASTTRTREAGVAALDEWLVQNNKPERFGEVFSNWMIASYLNDRTVDPRYGYIREGLRQMHVSPVVTGRLDNTNRRSDHETKLEDWQPLWIQNDISSLGSTDNVNVRISGASNVVWHGSVIARYRDGSGRVMPFRTSSGVADVVAPGRLGSSQVLSVVVALGQGTSEPIGDTIIGSKPATITLSLDAISGSPVTPPPAPSGGIPMDGDLIRQIGQPEIYVVWGPYRRYLPDAVLALYGFQNRPVAQVSNEIFLRYRTSNYVREVGQQPVFALWPDGTKHWFAITAAQWDASGRDWGAIFVVNSAEINWYRTGENITR